MPIISTLYYEHIIYSVKCVFLQCNRSWVMQMDFLKLINIILKVSRAAPRASHGRKRAPNSAKARAQILRVLGYIAGSIDVIYPNSVTENLSPPRES